MRFARVVVGALVTTTVLAMAACFDFGGLSDDGPGGVDATTDASEASVVEGRDAGDCDACAGQECFEGTCDGRRIVDFSTGCGASCAVVASGSVWCWGDNSFGEVGVLSIASGPAPVEVPSVYGATHVSVGVDHVCATTSDGKVWCWGHNDFLELGRNDPTASEPAVVEGVAGATAVSAGRSFTCALTNGSVTCWGDNRKGELGRGTVDPAASTGQLPAPTLSFGASPVDELGAGLANEQGACARVGGDVYCWGSNASGALGHDAGTGGDEQSSTVCTQCNATPTITEVQGNAQGIGVGGHTSCASTSNGPLCWGLGAFAQLGPSEIDLLDHPQPVLFSLPGTVSVSMRDTHGCTILTDGSLHCWGTSWLGALGNGRTSDTTDGGCNGKVPCDPNPEVVYNFAAGSVTTGCDITLAQSSRDGTVWSWGRDDTGQLGRPTTQTCDRPNTTALACDPVPHPVLGLP